MSVMPFASTATASHRIARLAMLALMCANAGCDDGGSAPVDAGDPDAATQGEGMLGERCERGVDCISSLCLPVAGNLSVCTELCDPLAEATPCPPSDSWTCEGREEEPVVCRCQADNLTELCADGVDNDCNGATDDCRECGALLVPPNDPQHCGDCGRRCALGATCDGGECVCSEGRGEACLQQPGEAECEEDFQCEDGIDCTEDLCNQAGRCTHTAVPARCAAGEVCNLLQGGCQPGRACAVDVDCLDPEPCTTGERCDPATKVCLWVPLDGDGDGQPPRVCGGTDCNDDQAYTAMGALERCDGIDNDCDGLVDLPLPDDACPRDRVCQSGACECVGDVLDCNGECVDGGTDERHCGACGNRCPSGSSCQRGQCRCEDGLTLCATGCRDLQEEHLNCGSCGNACDSYDEFCGAGICQKCPFGYLADGVGGCYVANECQAGMSPGARWCSDYCATLATDDAHCGACFNDCAAGTACEAGSCVCQGGAMDCGGACQDLQSSRDHCGACDNACTSACAAGSCLNFEQVVAGHDFSCARTTRGEVYCFGSGTYGVLGRGSTTVSYLPIHSSGGFGTTVKLAVGATHVCALTSSGLLYCWGNNNARQASTSTVSYLATPALLTSGVVDMALGYQHTCVIRTGGETSIDCIGLDADGQRGDGAAVPSNGTWTGHAVLPSPSAIAAGRAHMCAIQAGALYCWGANADGQLGLGDLSGRDTPTAVPGMTDIVSMALGQDHTCVLTGTGKVFCWGDNDHYQVGNGMIGDVDTPYEVIAVETATAVRAGQHGSCAVMAGEPLCWGQNSSYQLGNGSSTVTTAPTAVDDAAVGGLHTFAIGSDHGVGVTSSKDGIASWGASPGAGTNTRTTPGLITWP